MLPPQQKHKLFPAKLCQTRNNREVGWKTNQTHQEVKIGLRRQKFQQQVLDEQFFLRKPFHACRVCRYSQNPASISVGRSWLLLFDCKKILAYRICNQPKALLVKYQIIIKLNSDISKCVSYFFINFNIMVMISCFLTVMEDL